MSVSEKRAGSSSVTLPRVAFLLVLFVAAKLWSDHHFGSGLLGWIGSTAIPAIGLVAWMLGKSSYERVAADARRVLAFIFSTHWLLVLYTLFIAVALFWGTVVVERGSARQDEVIRGRLFAPGLLQLDCGIELSAKEGEVRRHILTYPLGRAIVLHIDGFLPDAYPDRVWPLRAHRINLGRQLTLETTILFRLPETLFALLNNGGRLRVDRVGGRAPVESTEPARAYRMGSNRTLLNQTKWTEDAQRVTDDPTVQRALLNGWSHPVTLPTLGVLERGSRFYVEVVMNDGSVVARKDLEIVEVEVQDVLIE